MYYIQYLRKCVLRAGLSCINPSIYGILALPWKSSNWTYMAPKQHFLKACLQAILYACACFFSSRPCRMQASRRDSSDSPRPNVRCATSRPASQHRWRTSLRSPDKYRYKMKQWNYYNDVIMSAMASPITSLSIIYSTVYWGTDQRKQTSASQAFVRGIHRWLMNSPHKGPVTQKCSHLMTSSWWGYYLCPMGCSFVNRVVIYGKGAHVNIYHVKYKSIIFLYLLHIFIHMHMCTSFNWL